MQGVKSLLFKSFWLVFNLLMGASGSAMLPLSSTQMPQKELKIITGKEAHAALVKAHLKPPPF